MNFSRIAALLTPHSSRWQPMLGGLAAFALAVATAVLMKPTEPVAVLLVLLGLAAWLVGACAMVGYVRWFIAGEVRQAKKDNERPDS